MTFEYNEIEHAYHKLVAQACGALTGLAIAYDQKRVQAVTVETDGEIVLFADSAKAVKITLSDARNGYRALMGKPIDDPDLIKAMASAIMPLVNIAGHFQDGSDADAPLVQDSFGETILSVADIRAAQRSREPISYREALYINRPLAG